MTHFISFKQNPSRLINYKSNPRWKQLDSGLFVLTQKNIEEDKQYTPLAYINETKQFDTSGNPKKAYDPNEKMWVAGVANANIVDRAEEKLDPRGCIVQDYLKNPQILAHHCYYWPVGRTTQLEIGDGGVNFAGWVGDPSAAPLTEMQIEMRSLLAQTCINTVSVGFIPLKIRAPLYNQQGGLEEPLIIEQWELLEISLVAVPCNQGSLIEVSKHFQKHAKIFDMAPKQLYEGTNAKAASQSNTQVTQSFNDSSRKHWPELESKNLLVQILSLEKTEFTKEDAKGWVDGNGFISKNYVEEATAHTFVQSDKQVSRKTLTKIQLSKGVFAVAGKEEAPPADQSKPEQMMQEMMSLMQQMSQGVSRVGEVCDLILKKMEEKPASEPPPSEEEGKAKTDEVKALATRIENLEKGMSKLVSLLQSKKQ